MSFSDRAISWVTVEHYWNGDFTGTYYSPGSQETSGFVGQIRYDTQDLFFVSSPLKFYIRIQTLKILNF